MITPSESRAGGKTTFIAFGKSFATRTEAEKHIAETIERREAIAGRRLTDKELLRGPDVVREPGWQTPGERIAADKWRPIQTPQEPKPVSFDPVERPGEYLPMPAKKRAALAEQAYYERLAREQGAEAPTDPQREKARDYALSVYEKVLFNPASTDAQVARARQLVEQSSHCLEHFATMANELAAETAAQHATLAENLNNQIAASSQRLNCLAPLPPWQPNESESEQ